MANDRNSIQVDLQLLHEAVGKLPLSQSNQPEQMKTEGVDQTASEIQSIDHHQEDTHKLVSYQSPATARQAGHPIIHGVLIEPTADRTRSGQKNYQEQAFRRKFWVSLGFSIPALLFSPVLQVWLGYRLSIFAGAGWITPIFAVIVFLYGGLPFLKLARLELQNHIPGMMTLISAALMIALGYSLSALFISPAVGTLTSWELVTLIDMLLLGCWIEMRSARQAKTHRMS